MDRNLATGLVIACAAATALAVVLVRVEARHWPLLRPTADSSLARAVDLAVQLPVRTPLSPAVAVPVVAPVLPVTAVSPASAAPRPASRRPPDRPRPPAVASFVPARAATPAQSAPVDSAGQVAVDRGTAAGAGPVSPADASTGQTALGQVGAGQVGAGQVGAGQAETSPSGSAGEAVFAVTAVDRLPVVLEQPAPDYPEWARRQHAAAVVLLQFVVTAEGRVAQVRAQTVRGDARLAAVAVRSLQRWRFRPAERQGRPVAVRVEQELAFELEE